MIHKYAIHHAIAILFVGLIGQAAFGELAGGGARAFGEPFASRSAVVGQNGIVATSQPLASLTAIEILKQGGSAVDAAIAANAILSLLEPHMCGPGGDLFAIVWDPETSKLYGLNASGRSPKELDFAAIKKLVGRNTRLPEVGPLTITVPGAVDGWFELHKRFGRLPFDKILEPAVGYANKGAAIPEISAALWSLGDEELHSSPHVSKMLANFEDTFRVLDGPPAAGTVFRNPHLATTYQYLAEYGRDGFYKGEIAQEIVNYVRRMGGYISMDDMSSHHSTWVDPVSTNYRGYDVFQLPPNGQGMAVLQILNILEGFDIASMGYGSSEYWHVFIEAKKLAYEDLAKYYSDPGFSSTPTDWLLSKNYAQVRRELIDMDSAAKNVTPGLRLPNKGDTTYISVADSSGMMVSLIQSNYGLMGSGLVPDGLGFTLQNRGSQFSLDPDHQNRFAAHKRPFHTIIPGFVMKDGKPLISLGVVGGAMQPQGQVQILTNRIDFGMNLQAAGDAARLRHSGSSTASGRTRNGVGSLQVEIGVANSVVEMLKAKGHVIKMYNKEASDFVGGYQAIEFDSANDVYRGASDMRLDGAALAY